MACFLVPATEAIVTTLIRKKALHYENHTKDNTKSLFNITISQRLGWLNKMLWGGSALLGFEHIWHGEVTPWFPFLTATTDVSNRATMFHEMATVGVAMAATVTATWFAMNIVVSLWQKHSSKLEAVQK